MKTIGKRDEAGFVAKTLDCGLCIGMDPIYTNKLLIVRFTHMPQQKYFIRMSLYGAVPADFYFKAGKPLF